jgi:hypothetical protein
MLALTFRGHPFRFLFWRFTMMTSPSRKTLFDVGEVTTTAAALKVLDESGETREEFLDRHVSGDWGTVLSEGRQRNDQAVASGAEIVSEYRTGSGAKIRVLTEATNASGIRPGTAILLPSEMSRPVDNEIPGLADESPVLTLDGIQVS